MPGHSDIMQQRKMALELEKATNSIGDEKVKEFMSTLSEMPVSFSEPLKDRLAKMEADFGEMMFKKIAGGESLMPTLDRWTQEQIEKHVNGIIEETTKFFNEKGHNEITEQHVYLMYSFISLTADTNE